MLSTGLTSITFRKLSIDEIIALAAQAGLDGIEWGGDVHVPPGDTTLAADVSTKTKSAGLAVCSYGSYYRCNEEEAPFAPVLETAKALGTSIIRIWAGQKGSADADAAYRTQIAEAIRNAVKAASAEGITIALEYHGGTLTDTLESTHRLLKEVNAPELKLYWQPRSGGVFEEDLVELAEALPYLSHVHLFHWGPTGWQDRKALADGVDAWRSYLELVQSIGGDRYVIFEFVKGDEPDQLLEDAKVLKRLIADVS